MAETLHISIYPELENLKATQKIPLVMIHGWGFNSAVWQPLIDNFPDEFTDVFYIITVDLPGFGTNIDKELSSYSLANICQYIDHSITQPAIYLGWSLGGLVATEMALGYPEKVRALITVANSPCFLEEMVEQDGDTLKLWPGIKAKVLAAFHRQLKVDSKKTISGFLKIQAMGSPHLRKDIKQISQLVFQHEMASKLTLDKSLNLLETTDYRDKLQYVSQPFLRMYGEADSLVPKEAIEHIRHIAKNSEQHIFKQASHAPFISHADDFTKVLSEWLISKAKAKVW